MNNKLNLILTLLFNVILSTFIVAQAIAGKQGPQLALAELNRLSNPELFNEQLDNLYTSFADMDNIDQCYYKYLKAYQTAYKGDLQIALNDLLEIKTSCNADFILARAITLIANIQVISRNYQVAYESLETAIRYSELSNDKQTKIMTYLGASNVYNSLGQKDLSAQYSQLVYDLDPTSDNLCKANHFKLLKLINDEPLNKQDDIFNKTLKICNEAKNSIFLSFTKLYYFDYLISNFQHNKNEISSMISNLNDTEILTLETGYKNTIALHYALKAKLLLMEESINQAKESALKSLDFNVTLGNSEQFIMALEVLAQIEQLNLHYKSAYEYLKEKSKSEKAIFSDKHSKQIAYMSVKHANLAKVFEIEQLNQQNEVLALESKLAQQEANNQRLVIVLILTIMAFLIFWSVRIKKRHDYFKDVSEIDHLTKVLTRKAFEEQVKKLLANATDKNHQVQLAIMDLDLFKHVNDNHGHLIGDWVLKNVVYAVKELVTENMIIARLGGEEFCLVMSDADSLIMDEKLEKMRSAIEHLDCSDSGAQLSVTASFGVTSTEVSGYSLPLLLTHADVALFEAKKKGRNQVVRFIPVNGKH